MEDNKKRNSWLRELLNERKAAKDSKKASNELGERLAKKIIDKPRKMNRTSIFLNDSGLHLKKAPKGKRKIKKLIKKGDMRGLQKFVKETRIDKYNTREYWDKLKYKSYL